MMGSRSPTMSPAVHTVQWMRPIQMQAQAHIQASLFWEHCVIHSTDTKAPLQNPGISGESEEQRLYSSQQPFWFVCQFCLAKAKTIFCHRCNIFGVYVSHILFIATHIFIQYVYMDCNNPNIDLILNKTLFLIKVFVWVVCRIFHLYWHLYGTD